MREDLGLEFQPSEKGGTNMTLRQFLEDRGESLKEYIEKGFRVLCVDGYATFDPVDFRRADCGCLDYHVTKITDDKIYVK